MASNSRDAPQAWVNEGEKYALVGLSINTEGQTASDQLAPDLWVLSDAAFSVPAHWREWLGSIRTEEVEECNLLLLSKLRSSSPGVLDAESQRLQQRVWNFYVGLLLSCRFAPAHRPVLLTGARNHGEIDIRQQQNFESPIPCLFQPYPTVSVANIQLAARLGESIGSLSATTISGGRWRLFRTLHIYTEARTTPEIVDRIHQYCRCIDGLILPDIGKTKQQFKSRTEMFIGTGHHDLMGELYDIRSAVEHLHENRYLEKFDRAMRLDLAMKEAIVERIARTALAHVIGKDALWTRFANTDSLGKFWALSADERQRIWGNPIDLKVATADFDSRLISDGELGAA